MLAIEGLISRRDRAWLTGEMDDPLLQRIHEANRKKARGRRLAYNMLLIAWCPLLLVLVYGSYVWLGPATGVCPRPDPDGGLLRDSELCRGSASGQFGMLVVALFVWIGGLVYIAYRKSSYSA